MRKIIFITLFLLPLFVLTLLARPYLQVVKILLGYPQSTSYLILLGNNTEMRANGGFAGSFVKATVTKGKPKFTFHDIYVPAGAIKDHINAPTPIETAFKHGTWNLANADWEPDFPTSAQNIRWFFEKADNTKVDQLVFLPLETIKYIVNILGPVTLDEYQTTVTPENFYHFLQTQAEYNFFPGSTQKKDALTALGNVYLKTIQKLPPQKLLKIGTKLITDIQSQNLLIHSQLPSVQSLLSAHNLDGSLHAGNQDTFLIVETNLGANKANCCTSTETSHKIYLTPDRKTIRHSVYISLTNASTDNHPNPPFGYSGDYLAYLRLYLPQFASNISVLQNETRRPNSNLPQSDKIDKRIIYGLTEIGFFHFTSASTTSNIQLIYDLPTNIFDQHNYSLTLLKQNGMIASPQIIKIGQKYIFTKLEKSELIKHSF